jgi:hypothetical protein
MSEDTPSSLVGRCARVDDPLSHRVRGGDTNRSSKPEAVVLRSDQARDGTEFARRDLRGRGRAVCCAVPSLGRPSTNQVGQRGWEANGEIRFPRPRVSTPPSQQARLGALRSALRRLEGPGRSKYTSRLVGSPTQTFKRTSPGRRCFLALGQLLLLTPMSAV